MLIAVGLMMPEKIKNNQVFGASCLSDGDDCADSRHNHWSRRQESRPT